MGKIIPVNGTIPHIGSECFLAEGSIVVGDVKMGNKCSVWFNAVIRGDVNPIRIGKCTNIQDGAILHTLFKKSVVELGDFVSIGHGAIVHGAKVDNYALIGMNAVVMDYVHVGEGAIVAAGAVVLQNAVIEPYTLWAGCPAKMIRKIEKEQTETLNRQTAERYITYSSWFNNKENN